jgi:outer membrane lipoprotein SlyB
MYLKSSVAMFLSCAVLAGSATVEAQRRGDSARITIGVVEGAQRVQFDSGAGKGALLGGAAGWALARNQSSGRQAAAAAGGALLGSGVQKSRNAGTGMRYTVRSSAGSAISVVTDQTEVRIGDCVSVEETGDVANIRRVDNDLCAPASPAVHEAVKPELAADADRCHQAKERMFEAKTPEDVEVARQIMEAFCND